MEEWRKKLHDAVDKMSEVQAQQVLASESSFQKWARGILEALGIIWNAVKEAVKAFWQGLKTGLGY